jgi:hypothetical protein
VITLCRELSSFARRVALTALSSEIAVSAPIRVAANREPSLFDLSTGKTGGGDFAARVLFVSYARRF